MTPIPLLLALACHGPKPAAPDPAEAGWACALPAGSQADYAEQLGCQADFDALASEPLDASIPGARSSKTVIDRVDNDHLYFTNSQVYPIHYDFAAALLSGDGLPIVPDLGTFNNTEYYAPDRRFLLGAVTWYEGPAAWVYEIAPYDTADADMIADAFRLIAANAWFGEELRFHPTSEAVERVAEDLPEDVPLISTDALFAGIDYQPLNLGTALGLLAFHTAAEVEDYVNYREIVVLDEIPNDLSVVAGTITAEFQTPLAHINVLAQSRGTPNMALTGAYEDETLRGLEGRWVALTVGAQDWSITEVSEEEADAWWEAHRPEPVEVTPMDTSVTALRGCAELLDVEALGLRGALDAAVPAFGGKASNMGGLALIGEDVPMPDCFAVPIYWYDQHMRDHGLWDLYAALTEDPGWGEPETRADLLKTLRDAIEHAPVDAALLDLVWDRITDDFGPIKMRFRSSTNAEDLAGFTGAGLYDSESGDYDRDDIEDAIRAVWSSVWDARAWEEREYWGIPHTDIGMGLLVNPTYDEEQANGVAVTGNVYDRSGVEPAFYINAQVGEEAVVSPEPGVTTDQILYYFTLPGQPIVYIAHSNLVAEGETVLDEGELYQLGVALDAIHSFFYEAYGSDGGWYAMDTEFKLVDGAIEMKQARPYTGWSRADE